MKKESGKDDKEKIHWKEWLGEGHFGKRLALALIFFLALAAFLHFREVRLEPLELNTTSERYIIGQVDFAFPDEEATQVLKQQSVKDVGEIYRLSEKQLRQLRFDFESFLLTRADWRERLKETTFDQLYRGADRLEEAMGKARFTSGRTLQKMHDYNLQTENVYVFMPEDIQMPVKLPKSFWEEIEKKVFKDSGLPKEAASFILEAFENQSYSLKEDVTTQRNFKQIIQEKVPSQYTQVKAGTRLVEPGERVTQRHLSMLQSMKDAIAYGRNLFAPRTILGSLLLSLIFTSLSILYFRTFHKDILNSLQKIVLVVTIVILTLILSKIAEYILVNKATYLIDIFRYPIIVPFAAILIYVLVSPSIALFISAFLTVVLGVALALYHLHFFERPTLPRRFGFTKILRQKLHIQTDRGERVLDFVSQPARQSGDLRILIDQLLPDVVG